MTPAKLVIHSKAPAQTQALGRQLGARLHRGDFVALCGPLGAGKTCFVQGLGEGLEVEGRVTSPTFIIIRHHPGRVPLCHADAYRISSSEELEDAGLSDCLGSAVVAVEWAEVVQELWPEELYVVQFEVSDNGRRLELTGHGRRPTEIVTELSHAHSGH